MDESLTVTHDDAIDALRQAIKPLCPIRPPRYFKRLRRWWAMLMLRRSLAQSGVHVWKYSDEELKVQCKEGLRQCVEMLEADNARRTANAEADTPYTHRTPEP